MLSREWKPYFNLKKDMLRTLLIWIKLPQLQLYLWGSKSLSKIVRVIGTPLLTDECITSKLRISYSRILVEVENTQELSKEITIKENEGKKIKQLVMGTIYETIYEVCKYRNDKGYVNNVNSTNIAETIIYI